MGYSIACHARSKRLLRLMRDFMESNYKEPHDLFHFKWKYSQSRLATNLGDEAHGLSYDHRRSAIGFDYNASDPERDYIFSITRWMTLKIGRRKFFKGIGTVPYLVYDGVESMPVLIATEWEGRVPKDYRGGFVDAKGYRPQEQRYRYLPRYKSANKKEKKALLYQLLGYFLREIGLSVEKVDRLISDELSYLDEEWERYIKTRK